MMHHVTKPTSPHLYTIGVHATVEFYSTPFGSYASPSVYCTNILLSLLHGASLHLLYTFGVLQHQPLCYKDSIADDADAQDAMHVVLYIKFSI